MHTSISAATVPQKCRATPLPTPYLDFCRNRTSICDLQGETGSVPQFESRSGRVYLILSGVTSVPHEVEWILGGFFVKIKLCRACMTSDDRPDGWDS